MSRVRLFKRSKDRCSDPRAIRTRARKRVLSSEIHSHTVTTLVSVEGSEHALTEVDGWLLIAIVVVALAGEGVRRGSLQTQTDCSWHVRSAKPLLSLRRSLVRIALDCAQCQ